MRLQQISLPVLIVLPSQNHYRRTDWKHLSEMQIFPQPMCLWRVVRAERASSLWPALIANLKSFHSTMECCMTILNYSYQVPQLCLTVMNGSNLVLVRKLALNSWDTINGSDTGEPFHWMLSLRDYVQNTHVNNAWRLLHNLSFFTVWQRCS